jgi:hypothetical protein
MWRFGKYYPPAPKINWMHDCWTLTQIMNRRQGVERRTLQALIYLRAGVSYTRTAKLVKVRRPVVVNWALLYKGFGLELLVKPPIRVNPMFDNRIKRLLLENPDQFRPLMSGEDMGLYADWAEVPSEILAAWIVQREYDGEKQFVRAPKRSYTRGRRTKRKS